MWEPGVSLDDFMPPSAKQMAKDYLADNDELSTWFLDQHDKDTDVDGKGCIVNFVTIKEVVALYKEHDIYKCMKAEDKRRFSAQKIKADFEKNIVLKPYFKQAKKVKLAGSGKLNSAEGIIHFKRKRDGDDEGVPSSRRPCMNDGVW